MGKNKVNAARLIALAASKLRSMLIATFVAVVAAKKTDPRFLFYIYKLPFSSFSPTL